MTTARSLTLAIPDQQVRDLIEKVVSKAPISIVIADSEGFVIGANRASFDLAGFADDRIVLDRTRSFVSYLRALNPEAATHVEKAFTGATAEPAEFFFQAREGSGILLESDRLVRGVWISTRAFAIHDDEGRLRYVVIMTEDISGRKELESRLAHARKMETIGTLAGGIAHDFNNILAGVVGYASLLAQTLPEGSRESATARAIVEAGERAANLTRQLLTVARRAVPSAGTVRLGDMLVKVVEFMTGTIGPNHTVALDVASNLDTVDGDRTQIEQVITNLCLNARDAMPDGGTILIRAANRNIGPGDPRPLPVMPPGAWVEISVVDNGVGMSPDIVGRVFEPFFTTKATGRGAGLGLAIVYAIVKSHQGYISVKSAPGSGSAFSVFLPKGKGAISGFQTQPLDAAALRAVSRRPQSVLLVEDDATVRGAVREMLRKLGHDVTETDSVKRAMGTLAQDWSRFDLIVADVIMPGGTGFDLVEQLRRDGRGIPVLLVSGYTTAEVRSRARSYDGVVFLPKPFTVETLQNALERTAATGRRR